MIEQLNAGGGDVSPVLSGPTGALPFLLDQYGGLATYRGKPVATLDGVVDHLDAGVEIAGKKITFTFIDNGHPVGLYNNPNLGFPEPGGYSPFSDAQREAARVAMKLWDDLIPQSIQEKNGNGADIVFANTTTGPAQAWAYYPGHQKYTSDVWTASPEANWTNNWLNFGGYGFTTLVHEAGHALGLSHPGEYNYGDDNDGDGQPDPITYLNDAFYAQDSKQFTIMSYFEGTETGAYPVDVEVGLYNQPQTPLLHDIYVIQQKYGADPTTRAGDTVYGFHSNAGAAVYDFTQNGVPYLSIYDAGGNDTLDLSGANAGVFLDLRPGAFSSAAVRPTLAVANAATDVFNAATDEVQGDFGHWTQAGLDNFLTVIGNRVSTYIASTTGVAGVQALSFENISIAYNTIIENAVGGSARDYIVGNDANNRIDGGAGNDVLNGLGGNDTLIGGAGADEFRFTALGGTDRLTDFGNGADVLNLREIDANTTVAGDQAFTIVSALSKVAGQAALTYQGANQTTLSLDVDGDGKSDLDIVMAGHVTSTSGWLL